MRAAWLAEAPEITLRDLLDRFSYDCLWRTQSRTKRGRTDCGVYLPDLEHKRPPDLPPGAGQAFANPGQTAYAFSTALPDKAYATSLIGSASPVASAVLGPRDMVFGTAIMGANYAPRWRRREQHVQRKLDL
jgi:hypothetical protein